MLFAFCAKTKSASRTRGVANYEISIPMLRGDHYFFASRPAWGSIFRFLFQHLLGENAYFRLLPCENAQAVGIPIISCIKTTCSDSSLLLSPFAAATVVAVVIDVKMGFNSRGEGPIGDPPLGISQWGSPIGVPLE